MREPGPGCETRTAAAARAALLLALAAPCAAGPCAAAPSALASPGPYPVGVRTIVLTDASRDDPHAGGKRTLVTDVWYPAAEEARGKPATTFIEFFGPHPDAAEAFVRHFGGEIGEVNRRFKCVAVRGAPLVSGKFPFLLFSHGNGGLRHQNVFQLDHLASHGYVIASPDHTGNAGVTVLPDKVVPYDRKGRQRSALDREKDIVFLIDRLLEEARSEASWLRGALDAERIGVLGHSFGGLTCCQAAAADSRVKAILPMTLALTKPAKVPMLLMLGALDRTVDALGNTASTGYYMSCTGPKHLLTLKRGGHFSFSDMDRINPAFGDGIGVERKDGKLVVEFLASELTKEIINTYSLAFFERYLRGDARAGEVLRANACPEEVELRSEEAAAKIEANAGERRL
ncbi:MAG: alpha/beta fold hydrolase [Planctomycetes bacterium]|nr:alpha/beta fold hydrolase [Planctomycetota bacterium]